MRPPSERTTSANQLDIGGRSTGVQEYWSTGVLEFWSVGVLERWSSAHRGKLLQKSRLFVLDSVAQSRSFSDLRGLTAEFRILQLLILHPNFTLNSSLSAIERTKWVKSTTDRSTSRRSTISTVECIYLSGIDNRALGTPPLIGKT